MLSLKYRFTELETELVWALMLNHRCTTAYLTECLWPNPDLMPDCWYSSVNVCIYNVRKKIKGSGWMIKNLHGQGYSLVEIEGV